MYALLTYQCYIYGCFLGYCFLLMFYCFEEFPLYLNVCKSLYLDNCSMFFLIKIGCWYYLIKHSFHSDFNAYLSDFFFIAVHERIVCLLQK